MIAPEPNLTVEELEPAENIALENDRMTATSEEPWLRFRSLAKFQAKRFVEISYRSSLYDDPVRPVLRFLTASGVVERFLPGPVAGAGVWRGAVPGKLQSVLICPAARAGRFDFIVESVRPLDALEIAALVWARRPRKLFDIALASAFGYFAEAENAIDWAIGAESFGNFSRWRARRARDLDASGVDSPRCDWRNGPSYSIFVDACGAPSEAVARTIASLRAQSYEKFAAVVIGSDEGGEAFARDPDPRVANLAAAPANDVNLERERFLLFLRSGDSLLPHALALVTEELARVPEAKLLYGDELIEDGGGARPLFKPDWSPAFDAARPYLGRSLVLSAAAFSSGPLPLDVARFQQRAREIASGLARKDVVHLRRWLLSRGEEQAAPIDAARAAAPTGAAGGAPSVTIVLPTKDRAELLGPCIQSVLSLSTHGRFELLVIDNGTRQAEALSILGRAAQDGRVRVLPRPGPFNFAAFNNEAARAGSGQILVFLNNDTVVLSPDWLERLCEEALKPESGAVGCLLLYPNGMIQHAGVVVGIGQDAGHFEALQTPEAPSWLDRTRSPREVSAVTAACLAVQREKFFAVGGFDEENLPIEFNDIDLCLRLAEKGWTARYTPHARLIHKESATRGSASVRPLSKYAKERDHFRARWRAVIRDDPYFHPGFSLYSRQTALG